MIAWQNIEMSELRRKYSKLDMPEGLIREFSAPPHSPQSCVFALTTKIVSADLKTVVTPCGIGLALPETVGGGPLHFAAAGLCIDMIEEPDGTRLRRPDERA